MADLAMSQVFVMLKSIRSNFAILQHDGRVCVLSPNLPGFDALKEFCQCYNIFGVGT
jgi:hypothetical protein